MKGWRAAGGRARRHSSRRSPNPASPLPQIHHTKHHATYVTNVNAALEKHPELATLTLLDLNEKVGTGALPADIEKVIRCVRGGGGGGGRAVGAGQTSSDRPRLHSPPSSPPATTAAAT